MGKSCNPITMRSLSAPDYIFEADNRQVREADEYQPDNSHCQVRLVINNLYECVSGDNYCRHLITFGRGKYCSSLLMDKGDWAGRIIPSNSEFDREQFD